MSIFSPTVWTALTCGIAAVLLVTALSRISAHKRASEPWLLRVPLLPLVLAVLCGLAAAYSLLLRFAFGAHDFKLAASANSSPIVVAATLVAGGLTAAYAVMRARAHLVAEARGRLDEQEDVRAAEKHRNDQEIAFVERFSKAVALLASDQRISRIAGAHLIFALGDEWPLGAQRCLDVLVSHLRGLRENHRFDQDDPESRAVREELELVTGEIFRRMRRNPPWAVEFGNFSGAALSGIDLNDLDKLDVLDLREAHVLGDILIPATAVMKVPRLSGLVCDGNIEIRWSANWESLDITDASVAGSVSIVGNELLREVDASRVQAASIYLSFDSIQGKIVLESSVVQADLVIGSPELGSEFGTPGVPVDLVLDHATFGELVLRRVSRGPRISMTGALGAVDLSYSEFQFEVDASDLNATAGFSARGARFDGPLVLNGATIPEPVDLEGFYLSSAARSAVESSEFELRDLVLDSGTASAPNRSPERALDFDWRSAIDPLERDIGKDFAEELRRRLSRIEKDLPLDWATKQSFLPQVMSEISRAAARTDTSDPVKRRVQNALREVLRSARSEDEQ